MRDYNARFAFRKRKTQIGESAAEISDSKVTAPARPAAPTHLWSAEREIFCSCFADVARS